MRDAMPCLLPAFATRAAARRAIADTYGYYARIERLDVMLVIFAIRC